MARIAVFTDFPFPSAFQANGRGFIPHRGYAPGAAAAWSLATAMSLMQARSTFPGTKPSSVWNSRVPNPPREAPAAAALAEHGAIRPHPRALIVSHRRPIKSSVPPDHSSQRVPGLRELHLPAVPGQALMPCPVSPWVTVQRRLDRGRGRGALVVAEVSVPSWDENVSPGAVDQCKLERFSPIFIRAPRVRLKLAFLVFPFITSYLKDFSLGPPATL